jgi:hypothetical protein
VVLEGPWAGADGGGEDLLEALGGGYCFYGFEILMMVLVILLFGGKGIGEGKGKYFYGLDLEFERRVFVYHDHGMWM